MPSSLRKRSRSSRGGVTGALIEDYTGSEVRAAVDRLSGLDTDALIGRANEYDTSIFDAKMRHWIEGSTAADPASSAVASA